MADREKDQVKVSAGTKGAYARWCPNRPETIGTQMTREARDAVRDYCKERGITDYVLYASNVILEHCRAKPEPEGKRK